MVTKRLLVIVFIVASFSISPSNGQLLSAAADPVADAADDRKLSQSSDKKTKVMENLRNVSIPQTTIKTTFVPSFLHPNSQDEFICSAGRSVERLVPLTRPEESNVVALLLVFRDKSAELNPRTINPDYGSIPELGNITLEQTDQLWGSNGTDKTSNSCRTYKLSSTFGEEFSIDLLMTGNLVGNYRVRGSHLTAPCWYSINK